MKKQVSRTSAVRLTRSEFNRWPDCLPQITKDHFEAQYQVAIMVRKRVLRPKLFIELTQSRHEENVEAYLMYPESVRDPEKLRQAQGLETARDEAINLCVQMGVEP